MREIRTIELDRVAVAPHVEFSLSFSGGRTTNVLGPCTVRVLADYVVERRVAIAQRRAPGEGNALVSGPRRSRASNNPHRAGRRTGDIEAHRERRKNTLTAAGIAVYTLRRRAGDERRSPRRNYNYASSNDPRIRWLERRGKNIHFGRPFGEQIA